MREVYSQTKPARTGALKYLDDTLIQAKQSVSQLALCPSFWFLYLIFHQYCYETALKRLRIQTHNLLDRREVKTKRSKSENKRCNPQSCE